MKNENLVNVSQASEILGNLHIMTIYRMASTGVLPVIKLGRRVMFKKSDLSKWINDRAKRKANR